MRISDWSSDVCSSDLLAVLPEALGYFVSIPVLGDFNQTRIGYGGFASATYSLSDEFRLTAGGRVSRDRLTAAGQGAAGPFTFRKRDRKRVVAGKRVSVRVDLGGRRIIKKKNTT